MSIKVLAAAFILVLIGGIARSQTAEPTPLAPIASTNIQGGGQWQTDGTSTTPLQMWGTNVTRGTDNSISGRVALTGSPLADGGNIQGHIIGMGVSGTLTDDSGNQIATFQGTITQAGMGGTYTDVTGETGSWSWNGPPPQ